MKSDVISSHFIASNGVICAVWCAVFGVKVDVSGLQEMIIYGLKGLCATGLVESLEMLHTHRDRDRDRDAERVRANLLHNNEIEMSGLQPIRVTYRCLHLRRH